MVSGTQNLDKRAVSSISGSPEGTGGCERVKLELHSPSSLASGQLWAVREGSRSHYSHTRQGGLRSRRMTQLARHLLLWSRQHLRSLRAIHIPGLLNRTADELSRAALPGELRLHPQTVQLIWQRLDSHR